MINKQLIIVGAAKSGTTTLAELLDMGSDYHMSENKEPKHYTNFGDLNWSGPNISGFVSSIVSDTKDYINLFNAAKPNQWCIDASTDYLWCKDSPDMIKADSKKRDIKVVIILRNPVSRIISEYSHTVRDQMENVDILNSLQLENQRVMKNYHPLFYHLTRSRYSEQIQRYIDRFSSDQILIIEFEELKKPQALVDKINLFTGSNGHTITESIHSNMSYKNKSDLLANILNSKNKYKKLLSKLIPSDGRHKIYKLLSKYNKTKVEIDEEAKLVIRDKIEDEILWCKQHLEIDTKHW